MESSAAVTVHKVDGKIDQKEFESYVGETRHPFIIRGLDLGSCTEKWSPEYICENGSSEIAVAHVSPFYKMNFIEKNFAYKKLPFTELVKRASCSENLPPILSDVDVEHYYFRSLGENVRKDASNFKKQFPDLQVDLNIPDAFPADKYFSSVFRMSSKGVQLWTHYDVMDNILIEVKGRKRVVLFPPDQALDLYLKNDKSLVVDIDAPDLSKFPRFPSAKRFECIMEEGDVLFIPALWFHNVTALDFCVAVNVFWKNLDDALYDAKDIYGNKDLNPAFRGQDMVNRATKLLNELPHDYKDFYARKLIQSIKDRCTISD